SGALGNCIRAPRRERLTSKRLNSPPELHEIFVRAHTRARAKDTWDRRWSPKWPKHCLIFDTETTLDPAQRLNFGTFRRCKLVGSKYVCIAEGIFYRDDLAEPKVKILQKYRENPPTLASVDYFPARTELTLRTRASFVSGLFWNSIKKGEFIVS